MYYKSDFNLTTTTATTNKKKKNFKYLLNIRLTSSKKQ